MAIEGTEGPKLTPYQRGKICGAAIAGFSPAEIQKSLGHSRGAVRATIKLDSTRSEGKTLPYIGAPLIYDDRD